MGTNKLVLMIYRLRYTVRKQLVLMIYHPKYAVCIGCPQATFNIPSILVVCQVLTLSAYISGRVKREISVVGSWIDRLTNNTIIMNTLLNSKSNHFWITILDSKGNVHIWVSSGIPFGHSLEAFVIINPLSSHIMSCGSEERYFEFGQFIIDFAMRPKLLYK